VGQHDGLHYYVMQFIQGVSLDTVLAELRQLRQDSRGDPGALSAQSVAQSLLTGAGHPPPDTTNYQVADTPRSPGSSVRLSESGRAYWESVARIGVQVALALAHAHQQGTLHRDIKPSNLLLDAHGNVWVTDFGLAKAAGSSDLTERGEVVGTLRYIPPERFGGQSDSRGDVYSLGLTLYELLTLRPAFESEDRATLLENILHSQPPAPRRLSPQVPRDLETIVLKAMAREPAHRYPSATELAEDLERFVEDRPIRARRVSVRERFWRWCKRNPVIASLTAAVLVLLAGVAAVATIAAVSIHGARNQAEARAEESRRRLVRLHVDKGVRLMNEGDLPGAAVLFAEALQLDQGDPVREEPHRIRLATVLRQCPRPVQVWSHGERVLSAEFSPDGKLVVTASGQGNLNASAEPGSSGHVHILDAASGEPVAPAFRHEGRVNRVCFSPDGRTVLSASHDGTARLLDVATGRPLRSFPHDGPVRHAEFSPDGRYVLTAFQLGRRLLNPTGVDTWPGAWRVWETQTGRPLTEPRKVDRLSHAAFSPDGKLVVTAGRQGELWEAGTGKRVRGLSSDEPYSLSHAGFSPAAGSPCTAHRPRSWTWPPAGCFCPREYARWPSGTWPSARTVAGWPSPAGTRRRRSGTWRRGARCSHCATKGMSSRSVTAAMDGASLPPVSTARPGSGTP
jgi:hypothetical protein